MVADLTGDPGRETVTQARKAEVDLAARHRLAPVAFGLGWQGAAAASGCAQQQPPHAPLPGSALGADEQQPGDHELDGVDFGLGQCLAGGEVLAAQRLTDTASEPLWVAAVGGAGEGDQFLAGGGGQGGRGRPALQHAQEGGGAHVRPSDLDRGGEDGQQIGAVFGVVA